MKKKKNLPLLENIEITGVAAEGKALTRVDDMVLFVPYCVPGDIVDIQVTRKKHSFMEGRVERVVKPSPVRCEPVCKHYGECGGCKWQILPYEEQLRYKQQQIIDNLTRIGKVELPEISPILGSKEIYEYRNKLEFTFSDRKWLSWDAIRAAGGLENVDNSHGLGFHIPNCFDKVLDITECHLMPEINNRIRNGIREYARGLGITFYNEHTHQGQLRTLILRSNHQGEIMLIVVWADEPDMRVMEYIRDSFPEIISLLYVVNRKFNDTIGDQEVMVFHGQDHIMEQMENLQFKVGPKSFYQTNTLQAYELYKVAREFAGLTGNELVFDLYTGTGTIANFVAHQARQVIGIEYVPEAIEDARKNAKINNIDNAEFFVGKAEEVVPKMYKEYGLGADVVVVDPPRKGCDEKLLETMIAMSPEKIVYVSCDSATLARDLKYLTNEGYEVECILEGLGQKEGVQEIYAEHVQDAIDSIG